MKMKKFIALGMAGMLSAATLVGCDNGTTPVTPPDNNGGEEVSNNGGGEEGPPAPTAEQSASVWSCDQRLGAPSNYTGGAYRLTLEQSVNGASTETTIVEGASIDFPYELKTTGAAGVTSGKVHLYEMVNGNYVIRANWEVPFTEG